MTLATGAESDPGGTGEAVADGDTLGIGGAP